LNFGIQLNWPGITKAPEDVRKTGSNEVSKQGYQGSLAGPATHPSHGHVLNFHHFVGFNHNHHNLSNLNKQKSQPFFYESFLDMRRK
jgi:hypothetical protein